MWGYVLYEDTSPSALMVEELGEELKTFDATHRDEDPDENLFPLEGREGPALEVGIGMLPKIALKPMLLLKEVKNLCNACAALLPKDAHKGMFAKRTILERLMENSRVIRAEDGWTGLT